jgi:hypothetical protein
LKAWFGIKWCDNKKKYIMSQKNILIGKNSGINLTDESNMLILKSDNIDFSHRMTDSEYEIIHKVVSCMSELREKENLNVPQNPLLSQDTVIIKSVCECGSTKFNTTVKDKPFCFLCGKDVRETV